MYIVKQALTKLDSLILARDNDLTPTVFQKRGAVFWSSAGFPLQHISTGFLPLILNHDIHQLSRRFSLYGNLYFAAYCHAF